MQKNTKRLLAAILSWVIIFSVVPMDTELISDGVISDILNGLVTAVKASEVTEIHNGVTYTIIDGVAEVSDYEGTATELVIPDRINGNIVVKIADRAFEYASIDRVTIPATITEVDWHYDGEDDSISYPHGPFANSSVKKVIFADGTETIPAYILSGCRTLTEVVIPDSMKVIDTDAFVYCTSLIAVHLPEALEAINERAFGYCVNITEIELPDTVKTLGEEAFYNCLSLETVNLGKVKELGEYCFVETSIEEIVLPATLEKTDFYYDAEADSISYPHGPFAGYELKKATFEDGIKTIPAYVLAGCRGLTDVVIPDSVKVIDTDAFVYCTILTEVDLPEALETINERAFGYCSEITEIIFPDATKTIEKEGFYNCSSLANVELYKVKELGEYCFVGTAIEEILLPATLEKTDFYYDAESDTPSYEHGPFAGSNLKKVSFEYGIKYIPDYVLGGCRGVTKIILPDNIEEIGKCAFEYCTSIKEILLPKTVKTINKKAFVGCTELKILRLYDSIKTIAEGSFEGLYILTKEDNTAVIDMIDNEIPYRAIVAGVKNKEYRLLDRAVSSYEIKTDKNGNSELVVRYDFKEKIKADISQTELKIKVPENTEFEYVTVTLNGNKCNDYCFDDGVFVIEDIGTNGVVTIKNLISIDESFSSYAQISGRDGKSQFSEIIGIVNPMNYSEEYEIAVKYNDTTYSASEEVICIKGVKTVEELLSLSNADIVTGENEGKIAANEKIVTGMTLSRYIGNVEVDFRQLAVLGDVDGDSSISAADARLALRASVGLEKFDSDSAKFASSDADNDHSLSAADARRILRASVGLEVL